MPAPFLSPISPVLLLRSLSSLSDLNECDSQPCQNGGTCLNDKGVFTCQCPFGFYGEVCENPVDNCDSQPCQNGGKCESAGPGKEFKCKCFYGFEGDLCQIGEWCVDLKGMTDKRMGSDPMDRRLDKWTDGRTDKQTNLRVTCVLIY